ncbi:MAG: hypothetical protein KZQ83_00710 [gamma proteobacterium symbiont of Taylorina sp.]|nr:hypothetical protein [gamma proteobacterium symbiont of Taylorina sp.]
MNRHTKIAIIIAPFLIIGGYIAADYYAQEQEKNKNLFKLSLEDHCDLTKKPCILSNKQLTLILSDHSGITQIDSNHPLEDVILSLVSTNNKETRYRMTADKGRQFWQSETQASALLSQSSTLKMRLIGVINKGYYFAEFHSRKN